MYSSTTSPTRAQSLHSTPGSHVPLVCADLSIIVALSDIGPGDGATVGQTPRLTKLFLEWSTKQALLDGPQVCIPASHKSMVGHPFQQQMVTEGGETHRGHRFAVGKKS